MKQQQSPDPRGLEHDWKAGGFALYVHWPFCAAKCPYCDFNSHVASRIDTAQWLDAYLHQIEHWGQLTAGRTLTSIFFGGGTPSLMEADLVAEIIAAARRAWSFSNTVEITLEANPSSSDASRFRDYASAGVGRLSLGVQALEDAALRALGRLHDSKQALFALDLARSTFERVSFDLIYARQHQSISAWRDELKSALSLQPDHLSLYQLTIEEGTAFHARHAIGKLKGLPDEDTASDMFDLTQDLCSKAGLQAYEVSNHAKAGHESRHNLVYWRYGDYVGIGPGAHGRVTVGGRRFATQQPRDPNAWLKFALDPKEYAGLGEEISVFEQAQEYLMMSLRLTEGTDLRRLERLAPGFPDSRNLETLIDDGLLWRQDGSLGATQKGRPLLNHILRKLI